MLPTELQDLLHQQTHNTRKTYLTAWKQWSRFVDWKAATFSDVLAYLAELRDLGRSDKTIQSRLLSLRSMTDVLVHAGRLKLNPFRDPRCKKLRLDLTPTRRSEMLPFEMVRDLLKLPDMNRPDGVRDSAAWAVMFGGGLRRSEVVGIRLDDVRATPEGSVYLRLRRTKSRKEQNQALPKWCLPYVTRLVAQRHQEGARNNDWLFVTYWGGRLTTAWNDVALYRRFKSYAERLQLMDVSPHSARATAITRLLSLGLAIDDVQEFARHKTTETTKQYDRRSKSIDDAVAVQLVYPGQ